MNKWLYKIRHYFNKRQSTRDLGNANNATPGVSSLLKSRELDLYGEEVYAQRRLYEYWVARDRWKLEAEAIPLVLGYDPEKSGEYDEEYNKNAQELIEHAKNCIMHALSLNAINREDTPEHWEVRPAEFYCWASVSRVQMPQSLVDLMEFVVSTVKGEKDRISHMQSVAANAAQGTEGQDFDLQTEKILGAALAVLAEFPEQCRNRKGRINVAAITELIQKHHEVWFPDSETMMSSITMQDLINKWIKTLKPVIHG